MKLVWQMLRISLLAIFILILHILVINLFPHPFNHINVIFLSLLWLQIFRSDADILWVGAIVLYITELFIGLPFGISSLSMFVALVILDWFLLNIFTNRPFFIFFLSPLVGLLLYRLILFLCLTCYSLFIHQPGWLNRNILIDIMWEMLLSSLVLLAFYFINSKFSKRMNPTYVNSKQRHFYG